MKKKLLVTLLTIAATLCCMAGFAGCNTDKSYTKGLEYSAVEENGEVTAYSVTGKGSAKSKNIIIPSEYKNKPVTAIGDGAFRERTFKRLSSITIPDSVTSIGNEAFYGCGRLSHITFPDGLTSIGEYAFYNCSGLISITFPAGVNSIGKNAFNNSSLETLVFKGDLADWCTVSGLFDMGIPYLYINGERLEGDLVIPEGITSIGDYAFSQKEITSVTIPDGVGSIGNHAFASCRYLTSVTIPDSVTVIGIETFEGCENLTDITFRGTAEQWNAIEKVSHFYQGYNPYAANYTIHCTDGNVTDGKLK